MTRIVLGITGVAGIAIFAIAFDVLLRVRGFEWMPLYGYLGLFGLAFSAFLAGGLAILTYISIRGTLNRAKGTRSRLVPSILLLWSLAIVWLAEWLYMQDPVTAQIAEHLLTDGDKHSAIAAAVHEATATAGLTDLMQAYPNADAERLAVMLARVSLNRPSVFHQSPIGTTILKYAKRYEVSPVLLLDWNYLDSFYGEAPAGPMPFFKEINGEMFRDLVQAHLPPWFIESRIRVAMIEGPWFNYIASDSLSRKLRYAFQKATYDIAIAPYMNSVFSDLFLLMRVYPNEFPELLAEGTSDPLGVSFRNLVSTTFLEPFDDPYAYPGKDDSYYEKHRDDLMTFARAAVYHLSGDFDFATKTQALVARYYAEQFAQRLGPDRWAQLSERQQTALIAMLRDVYVPNIGHVSSNLYMVPEFNTTPIVFLATEADRSFDEMQLTQKIWTPKDSERLWGATGLMLHTLSETWEILTGAGLPDVRPGNSTNDAVVVLATSHQGT